MVLSKPLPKKQAICYPSYCETAMACIKVGAKKRHVVKKLLVYNKKKCPAIPKCALRLSTFVVCVYWQLQFPVSRYSIIFAVIK